MRKLLIPFLGLVLAGCSLNKSDSVHIRNEPKELINYVTSLKKISCKGKNYSESDVIRCYGKIPYQDYKYVWRVNVSESDSNFEISHYFINQPIRKSSNKNIAIWDMVTINEWKKSRIKQKNLWKENDSKYHCSESECEENLNTLYNDKYYFSDYTVGNEIFCDSDDKPKMIADDDVTLFPFITDYDEYKEWWMGYYTDADDMYEQIGEDGLKKMYDVNLKKLELTKLICKKSK